MKKMSYDAGCEKHWVLFDFFFLFFIRNYFLGKSCWSDSTWNLTPPVVHVGWGKEGI